ncbi:MAG TPA: CHASE3 domain-containing protein, partial [Streptosporangiaceae bacterium]
MRSRRAAAPPATGAARLLHRWWLDRSVRAKGLIVVTAPLIALAITAAASLVLQAQERHERGTGRAAFALVNAAGQVLADALNGETGVRGYAATHDASFLAPYHLALTRIGPERQALRRTAAVADDSRGQQRIDAAVRRVFAGLAQLRSDVSRGAPDSVLKSDLADGKTTMDLLRREVAGLISGPAAILAERTGAINRLESGIGALNIAGLALGLLAGVAGVALFTSGISRRVVAAAANADRLGRGLPLLPVSHS